MTSDNKRSLVENTAAILIYTIISIYPSFILLSSSRKALAMAFLVGSFFALLNSIHVELKELNEKTRRLFGNG